MVNEERIRQVLEIEQNARTLYESSVHEAEKLPEAAEQKAREFVEQSVAEAHAEAKRMMEDAKAEKECAEILSRAEEELQRMEKGAAAHKERAIAYVLDAVAGVEEG